MVSRGSKGSGRLARGQESKPGGVISEGGGPVGSRRSSITVAKRRFLIHPCGSIGH